MIGEQQSRGAQLRDAPRRAAAAAADRRGRRGCVAELAVHLRQREPPRRFVPRARSMSHSERRAARPAAAPASACGARRAPARTPRRSATPAPRRSCSPPPSRHAVFIDSESLPTGMAMPERRTQLLADRAHRRRRAPRPRPARRRRPSSWPTGAPRASAAMSAARMLVIASATASRPEAGASSNATGVRSPIAIASPAMRLVVGERHRDVAHRHLPGTDQLIAADQAADGAIADGDEEGLVGHRRQAQHAIQRLAQIERGAVEAARAARQRCATSRACAAACRAAPRSACPPASLPNSGSCTIELPVVVDLADHGERAALARARWR